MTQRLSGRRLRSARSMTIALTLLGVVLGFVGWGRYDGALSIADRVYLSLQLVLLDGPNGVGVRGIPVVLNVGRFFALVGLAGTVLSVVWRLGANRIDSLRISRARDHVVVIGSSPEARKIAIQRTQARRERRASVVVLVGGVDDLVAEELRTHRIRVMNRVVPRLLETALKGADEVIIAVGNDGEATATLGVVIDSLEGELSESRKVPVRILVRSTSLARELRSGMTRSLYRRVQLAALSEIEAASHHLADHELISAVETGRSTHLVVVGSGELAQETAASLVERRCAAGNSVHLDLWPVEESEWCRSVERRVGGPDVQVQIHPDHSRIDLVSRAVTESCRTDDAAHQVFIIGAPDGDAIALAMRLKSGASPVGVIPVVSRSWSTATPNSATFSALGALTLGDLLAEPAMWAIDELLGRSLLESLELLADLPGATGQLGSLGILRNDDRQDLLRWAIDVAGALIVDLAACGLILVPTDRALDRPVLMSPVLIRMRDTLLASLKTLDGQPLGSEMASAVLSILQDLPEMVRRCGYSLEMVEAPLTGPRGPSISHESLVSMARHLHDAYVERAGRLGTGGSSAIGRSWDDLTADQRASNLSQARDLPVKLLRLGYEVVAEGTPGSTAPVVDAASVDRLAWFEHLRWMHSRRANGWTYGPVRDDARRIHHLLVPFEELPEEHKEHDRGPILLIPELLRIAGLAVLESRE